MSLFRRNAPVELPTPTLADEAVSTLGFHDAMKSQVLSDLREMERRLDANIEAETQALIAVRETIAREERASIGTALAKADFEISGEIRGLNVDDYEWPVAAEVEAKDKRRPKRAPKKAVPVPAE